MAIEILVQIINRLLYQRTTQSEIIISNDIKLLHIIKNGSQNVPEDQIDSSSFAARKL